MSNRRDHETPWGKPWPRIGPQRHKEKAKNINFKQADDTLGLHRDFYKNSDYVAWNNGRISK